MQTNLPEQITLLLPLHLARKISPCLTIKGEIPSTFVVYIDILFFKLLNRISLLPEFTRSITS